MAFSFEPLLVGSGGVEGLERAVVTTPGSGGWSESFPTSPTPRTPPQHTRGDASNQIHQRFAEFLWWHGGRAAGGPGHRGLRRVVAPTLRLVVLTPEWAQAAERPSPHRLQGRRSPLRSRFGMDEEHEKPDRTSSPSGLPDPLVGRPEPVRSRRPRLLLRVLRDPRWFEVIRLVVRVLLQVFFDDA